MKLLKDSPIGSIRYWDADDKIKLKKLSDRRGESVNYILNTLIKNLLLEDMVERQNKKA